MISADFLLDCLVGADLAGAGVALLSHSFLGKQRAVHNGSTWQESLQRVIPTDEKAGKVVSLLQQTSFYLPNSLSR